MDVITKLLKVPSLVNVLMDVTKEHGYLIIFFWTLVICSLVVRAVTLFYLVNTAKTLFLAVIILVMVVGAPTLFNYVHPNS